jgi:predicted Fe-Mo cluster-binding NifX family protein
MKIAFTTSGESPEAPLDERFGRAPRFIVYDTDANTFETIDNRRSVEAAQGAGIQAAQTIVRAGVQALVTGHCGPKAFRVLTEAGVAVYNCGAATVSEALERFRAGTLEKASSADVDGHWA